MTTTLPISADEPARVLDAGLASDFLRSQARWLTHGLEHSEDPAVVTTILEMHDSSHPLWLGLIGAVRRHNPMAAGELITAYSYCGLVAGSLERGLVTSMAWSLRQRVCSLLARRMDQLIDEAVYSVESLEARAAS